VLFLFRSKATRHEKAGKNVTDQRGIGGTPTIKKSATATPRNCRRRRRRRRGAARCYRRTALILIHTAWQTFWPST